MEINLVYRNEFIELVTPIIENEKVKRMMNKNPVLYLSGFQTINKRIQNLI